MRSTVWSAISSRESVPEVADGAPARDLAHGPDQARRQHDAAARGSGTGRGRSCACGPPLRTRDSRKHLLPPRRLDLGRGDRSFCPSAGIHATIPRRIAEDRGEVTREDAIVRSGDGRGDARTQTGLARVGREHVDGVLREGCVLLLDPLEQEGQALFAPSAPSAVSSNRRRSRSNVRRATPRRASQAPLRRLSPRASAASPNNASSGAAAERPRAAATQARPGQAARERTRRRRAAPRRRAGAASAARAPRRPAPARPRCVPPTRGRPPTDPRGGPPGPRGRRDAATRRDPPHTRRAATPAVSTRPPHTASHCSWCAPGRNTRSGTVPVDGSSPIPQRVHERGLRDAPRIRLRAPLRQPEETLVGPHEIGDEGMIRPDARRPPRRVPPSGPTLPASAPDERPPLLGRRDGTQTSHRDDQVLEISRARHGASSSRDPHQNTELRPARPIAERKGTRGDPRPVGCARTAPYTARRADPPSSSHSASSASSSGSSGASCP